MWDTQEGPADRGHFKCKALELWMCFLCEKNVTGASDADQHKQKEQEFKFRQDNLGSQVQVSGRNKQIGDPPWEWAASLLKSIINQREEHPINKVEESGKLGKNGKNPGNVQAGTWVKKGLHEGDVIHCAKMLVLSQVRWATITLGNTEVTGNLEKCRFWSRSRKYVLEDSKSNKGEELKTRCIDTSFQEFCSKDKRNSA